MTKYYLDAGTTYSKIIELNPQSTSELKDLGYFVTSKSDKNYYIIHSKLIKTLNMSFERACGHMGTLKSVTQKCENEIVALANGCKNIVDNDATILDLGSRDAKWIKFADAKFHDMDWNTSCASSTGATVEMLLKFYDVKQEELKFNPLKFPVTCGIFGLEKIMDDISKGADAADSISKFIHGVAYNAWNFTKKPEKIYLSGGFCANECFTDSLKHYCKVETLGRFVLCEGLLDE